MKQLSGLHKIWQSTVGCAAIVAVVAAIVCAIRITPFVSPREDAVSGMEEIIPHWDERSIFYLHDIPLDKGIYRVVVDYEVASDHQITIHSKEQSQRIFSTPVMLPAIKPQMAFLIAVRDDEAVGEIEIYEAALSDHFTPADFRITVSYIPLRTMCCYAVYTLGFFALLFAIIMLDRHCRKKGDEGHRMVICALIVLTAFICSPVFLDYVKDQNDTGFHMMRIAYLSDSLFGGSLQYRMQSLWNNGFGYPVAVFYGELLMIPSALLYALAVPLWQCFQFYIVLTSALTVGISYYAYKKITGDRLAGLFCCVLYAASEWHLHRAYIFAAMGEYAAYIFLPLVFLGFYELMTNEDKKKSVLHLTAGFTGLLQTHMITTVICVILSVIFCLSMADKIIKERKWITLLEAAGLTALVNLFFLVPFLDYYIRYDLVVEHMNIFIFKRNLFELFMPDGFKGLGAAALLSLVFALFLISGNIVKENKRGTWTLFALSLLCIGMSSVYFPWTWISTHLPGFYKISAANLQHAFRYLTPATALVAGLLAVLLHGGTYKEDRRKETAVWIVMASIMVVCVMQDARLMKYVMIDGGYDAVDASQKEDLEPYESDTLTAVDVTGVDSVGTGDDLYLTTEMDFAFPFSGELQTVSASDGVMVSDLVRKGTTFSLVAENGSDEDAFLDFPLWNYYGYKAKGDGVALSVTDGDNKNVRVTLPAGYAGNLKVSFQTPWYWRLADAVSIVAIVYLLCFSAYSRHKTVFY